MMTDAITHDSNVVKTGGNDEDRTTDGLISKEQAIDKIKKRLLETAFNNVGIKQNVDETLVDVAENRLGNWFDELPSAEPCGDAVSRNGIVQKLNKMDRYVSAELRLCDTDKIFPQNEVFIVDDVYEEIVEQLPSVQPDIIRCKDCAYCDSDVVDAPYGLTKKIWWCDRMYEEANENLTVEPDDFCSWAERRQDG